jgi:hypothetical protein
MRLGGRAPERMRPMCTDPRDATQKGSTPWAWQQKAPQLQMQEKKPRRESAGHGVSALRRFLMRIGRKEPIKYGHYGRPIAR